MGAPTLTVQGEDILSAVSGLVATETDEIANMANVAAVLYEALPNVNWVGFYIFKRNDLVLGPFQGRPACTRIPLGKGVCGTAAQTKTVLCVDDVETFAGHISCDPTSASEIVVPLVKGGRLLGVLDIDSPLVKRFTVQDQTLLVAVAKLLTDSIDNDGCSQSREDLTADFGETINDTDDGASFDRTHRSS